MEHRTSKGIWAGVGALVAIVLVGALLISAYIHQERQRDLQDWSIRLGLLAETRVETIEAWFDDRKQVLSELANNASLQLYLLQLTDRDALEPDVEQAQLTFLRNLILASAERSGFAPSVSEPSVPADLTVRHDSGLALLDAGGRAVVATPGMPALGPRFKHAAEQAIARGEPVFSSLVLDSQDRILLGLAVPVQAVLGASAEQSYVGVVFGVQSAERQLYPLLSAGAPLTDSDESLLVELEDKQVVYLSPTRRASKPTRKSLPMDREQLAAAAAVAQPGRFGAFRNYAGDEVLATSRPLRSVPWVLVQEVAAQEALHESDQHLRFLLIAFSLLLFFIAAILVAAWRHGSSVRAQHDAAELRARALELQRQTELLHAVTDNAEAYVALLDDQQRLLFANERLAKASGNEPQALTGITLAGVIGPANVEPLADAMDALLREGRAQHCTSRMLIAGEEKTLQCNVVPVERVGDRHNATLLVLHDISDLQRAQARHAALLRKLIATLMHVVDLHDPYSAHHSVRMVEVANSLGRELRLADADLRTLDMAASLANLGKIFVPREILTKTEPLTGAEQELVHRHVEMGLELLQDLEFEGPVLETIRQKQEHMDGSGYPQGLIGDRILLTARILAVANAFVALVSPRAYRGRISARQAVNRLLEEADARYDRHVVAALFHIVENRNETLTWEGADDAPFA